MLSDRSAAKGPEASIFMCKKCGECCVGYGGTFVTEKDIERISGYIGVERHLFVEQFCCLSGGRPVLAQKNDGHCKFWDSICTIHPVKPRMCRQWPYIESLLVDFDNWNVMASVCPGMKKNVSPHVVTDCVRRVIRKATP